MTRPAKVTVTTRIDYEDGEREILRENYLGVYSLLDEKPTLEYAESEQDSGELIKTRIQWSNEAPLEILVERTGAVSAKNVFRENTIDLCQYQTQLGVLALETETDSVEAKAVANRGRLTASYNLKINNEQVGYYQLTIDYQLDE